MKPTVEDIRDRTEELFRDIENLVLAGELSDNVFDAADKLRYCLKGDNAVPDTDNDEEFESNEMRDK